MTKKRILNIAIIGLGNIGSYLFKYLQTNKNIIKKIIAFLILFMLAKNQKKKRKIKINKKLWLKNI